MRLVVVELVAVLVTEIVTGLKTIAATNSVVMWVMTKWVAGRRGK